jgi:phosphohistidine swiveling domain-containing protein
MKNFSKAQTLIKLKSLNIPGINIEDIYLFTAGKYMKSSESIVKEVADRFSPKNVIVRSSSSMEDTCRNSMAGRFHSEQNVKTTSYESIRGAINKVIDSYKVDNNWRLSEVLVQPQVDKVAVSGVLFTRNIGNNSPYYVINYDDVTGRTDTITKGMQGSTIFMFRHAPVSKESRWYRMIQCVKNIEKHFGDMPLDIEFAITKDGKIVIFQVRPLAANLKARATDDKDIKHLIDSMKDKYERFSKRSPHLGGDTTLFTDMSDWNPAEIIGARPNTLDYGLYSFLVTDEVWHQARSYLGYADVFPGELMISFGKRPYINVRLSFNSLIPGDISLELRDKLVNYYMDKLRKNPEKQDKVEFEIVWTCYSFSVDKEMECLKENGFSPAEIEKIAGSLKKLTNNILKNANNILDENMKLVYHLTERKDKILSARINKDSPWDLFNVAYNLLQNCKKFGIFPFSVLARLAFIGKNILISMKDEELVSEEFYHNFLNSVETVLTKFNKDLNDFYHGKISKDDFLQLYGHLRPGTYDITAPRYDSVKDMLTYKRSSRSKKMKYRKPSIKLSSDERLRIDKALRKNGIFGASDDLLRFISESIEYREFAKFEFTKTLSEALEFLAKAGELLGFSREDLSNVDLATLMKLRNPEYADIDYAKKVIRQSMGRHCKEKEWSDMLVLPPVVASKSDFEVAPFYKSRPNFITNKTLRAPIVTLNKKSLFKKGSLKGCAVLLENADPGFDWVFSKKPDAIITKYGGVASHMSIRCAELGIPAAIGCGSSIYDKLLTAKSVFIDCAKQAVMPLTESR